MKTLFLYTQTEKESVEDYYRNLTSLCETAKAFGASPGYTGDWSRGGCLPNHPSTNPLCIRGDAPKASAVSHRLVRLQD